MTTQERNSEIKTYYKNHNATETAKKFGLSVASVYGIVSKGTKTTKSTKKTTKEDRPTYEELMETVNQQHSLLLAQQALLAMAEVALKSRFQNEATPH